MTNQKIEFEPYFGSFILETLTLGMYGEARTAIREYVQNAYDAITIAIEKKQLSNDEGRVDIVVDARYVSIRDNGSGLRKKNAVETLTNIGASTKDHRSQAGFRGIGRLSGLVMCDRLVFSTKAQGEGTETIVEFDAKGMRHDLSPTRASRYSLSDMLTKHIKAYTRPANDIDEHYFEVCMQDLYEPPIECTDASQMSAYLGEIAPVSYSSAFPGAAQIYNAALSKDENIEEIDIFVHDGEGDEEGTQVLKHYSNAHLVQNAKVPMSEVKIISSKNGYWWGWVGKKQVPGLYKEDSVRGIRVRVRNIQIDGTQVIGRIFGDIPEAASYGRFNDWYIGEIFANPAYLIPNARRDGFEELEEWLETKAELQNICRALGREAYDLSQKSQGSIVKLLEKSVKTLKQADEIYQKEEPSITEISKIITEIDGLQRKANRAMKSGDSATVGQLHTIETRLLRANKKVLSKIRPGAAFSFDAATKARHEVVQELIKAFDEEFDRSTFRRIMQVVTQVVGEIDE